MSKLTHIWKLKKQGDKLVHINQGDLQAYDLFKKQLPEGTIIQLYAEVASDNGTLSQLAKVHAMIRDLSVHTGFTFEETKMLVKQRAGLVLVRKIDGKEDVVIKSLADCDKDELSSVIQASIELGEKVGLVLN